MIQGLPGFRGPVAAGDLVAAAIALVAAPGVGWLLYRLAARTVDNTMALASWGIKAIVRGAVRDVVIVWSAIAGAFIALQFLRDGDPAPPVVGLRPAIERTGTALLIAALILSATFVAARVAGDLIKLMSLRAQGTTRSSSIFVAIARIVVVVIGLLFLLQTMGVEITPLLTALGVGGLAIALALQDSLSNFFAGLQVVATKKVRPGNYVRLEGGLEGYVTDVDWRHTSIRELPNNMVLVPNSRIANEIVTNFHYPEPELSVLVEVAVGYDSDLAAVERVTLDVARETLKEVDGGVPDFDPLVRMHTFDDSWICMTVILRAREYTDQFGVRHEFVKRLHERYGREGIEAPYPVRTVHLDGDRAPARRGARR